MAAFAAIACSYRHAPASQPAPVGAEDIVILYDNDVHCSVDGYANMAALKAEKASLGPVALVSAGDYLQGGSLGAASRGKWIVDIMNATGYDVVTLGNHEFDYSVPRMQELMDTLSATAVCCNLIDLRAGERMYAPYTILELGGRKVAFVGVATPYSFNSSTPSYFQDKEGNYVYSLCTDTIYDTIQNSVDDARNQGADLVIAVVHLGYGPDGRDPINATEMICRTEGIDAVIDGHTHTTVPSEKVKNRAGRLVHYTQTGSHFEKLGVMTIGADGSISSRLIPTKGAREDARVKAVIDSIKNEYARLSERRLGSSEVTMKAVDYKGEWLVRNAEQAIGDFCADAFRAVLGTDIAMLGGGSIRNDLKAGEVTWGDIFSVHPFDNIGCIAELRGSLILDVLELGVSSWPADFGGFLQVSGLIYSFDPSVESPVVFDENKSFVRIDPEPRRIREVKVLNPATGKYESLDPERTYTVGSTNYLLRDAGDGYSLLKDTGTDQGIKDAEVLEKYIEEQLGGTVPASLYGKSAGRIRILR